MNNIELSREEKRLENNLKKKEEKLQLIQEYESILEVAYKIYGGQVLVADLKDFCRVFGIANEDRVNEMIKNGHKKIIEKRVYNYSSNVVLIIKKPVIIHFSGNENSKSVKYNDNEVRRNCFKTRILKQKFKKTKFTNLDELILDINKKSTFLVNFGDFERAYSFWENHFDLSKDSYDLKEYLKLSKLNSILNLKGIDTNSFVNDIDIEKAPSKVDREAIHISCDYLTRNYIYTYCNEHDLIFYIFDDTQDLDLSTLSKLVSNTILMLYENLEASPFNSGPLNLKNASLLKRIKFVVYCYNQDFVDRLSSKLVRRTIVYADKTNKIGPSVEEVNLLVESVNSKLKYGHRLDYQAGFNSEEDRLDVDFLKDNNNAFTIKLLNTAIDTRHFTCKVGILDAKVSDRLSYYNKIKNLAKSNLQKKEEKLLQEAESKAQKKLQKKANELDAREKELLRREAELERMMKIYNLTNNEELDEI